jgi:hypothetical protein
MVSSLRTSAATRKLEINLSPPSTPAKMVTPLASRRGGTNYELDELAHPITSLRNTDNSQDDSKESSDDEQVEFIDNKKLVNTNDDCNLVIPKEEFVQFIADNFICKHCSSCLKEDDVVSVRIGCASNVFWNCSSSSCTASGTILAKQVTNEHTNRFLPNYKELSPNLGDYDINRQVVLACQMSGGAARMASTISGCLNISLRSIWINNFSKVEQLIGKSQISLGKIILAENMVDEIAASPVDPVLNKAMLTMMMDGGWDQRASGKAYDSSSGRVIGVGGITSKVCHLVYYSKT